LVFILFHYPLVSYTTLSIFHLFIFIPQQGKPDIADEVLFKRQTQELQNGRLAMIATLELLRHDTQNSVSPGFDGLDNLITGLPFLY
jgi:Chlorophyll A-B binding protein